MLFFFLSKILLFIRFPILAADSIIALDRGVSNRRDDWAWGFQGRDAAGSSAGAPQARGDDLESRVAVRIEIGKVGKRSVIVRSFAASYIDLRCGNDVVLPILPLLLSDERRFRRMMFSSFLRASRRTLIP